MISGVSTPTPRAGQFENSDQGDYESHRHPAEKQESIPRYAGLNSQVAACAAVLNYPLPDDAEVKPGNAFG
jgi:hypothetical protein